jgi:hypothetical protein
LRRLFADHGGILRLWEIDAELGLADEAGERAALRALERGEYLQCTPYDGWRKAWLLSEDERARLPLPGDRIMVDTLLTQEPGDVIQAVNLRRRQIGETVEAARSTLRLSLEEVLAGDVGEAFAACLEVGTAPHHTVDGEETLSAWWRGLGENALSVAWENLALGPPTGEPSVVSTLDAKFWRVLSDRLKADCAGLSRGIR